MAVFFNGRNLVTPTVASQVDDSAMFNPNPGIGNVLAVVGRSAGGAPNTPLVFGNATDAAATLVSGDLVDAITRAFDPSAETAAPQSVVAVRVNPAVQSALTLLDGSGNPTIALVSADYGLRTGQTKMKVEAGSLQGLRITTQLGNAYYVGDNLYRAAFQIQYVGAQTTARMTVSNTTVSLEAPNATVAASIDLNTYQTVQQLVDRINAVPGFSASVLNGNGATPALNGLDPVTQQDVRTGPYTATGALQAIVDWLNSPAEGLLAATRIPGSGGLPAIIPFTYLSGGSDGLVTNTQWANAFTALQTVDTQWVVPCSTDPAIHAMTDAHVAYMSGAPGKERRAICGTPLATTDATAISLAAAINSDRTSLVHLGVYDYDANSNFTLYQPFVTAAMIAGAFAGLDPGRAMTHKSLKVRGIERKLRNPTDTDALIQGGVMCVASTPTGYRVVQSITTWLTNRNYNRVEVSTGVAMDYTARAVRTAQAPLKGEPGSPQLLGRAAAAAETALMQCAKLGVIVGDANSPAFKNITVTLSGDVLTTSYQASPVIPANYVLSVVHAVPYSGTLSL